MSTPSKTNTDDLGMKMVILLVYVYSFTYRQTGDAALAYALVGITVRR